MSLKGPSERSLFTGKRIFLFLASVFLSLCSLQVTAQGESLRHYPMLFRGVVLDGVTQQAIEGVKYTSDSVRYTNSGGMFSFFAQTADTVVFEHPGYRSFVLFVPDTLHAHEYTTAIYMHPDTVMIGEVVIIPYMGDIKYEIMSSSPKYDIQSVNAANNMRISAYQGLTGMNKLGDPASNYRMLQEKQKINAFEKGGIPSDQMVSLSPFIVVPAIYLLVKGLPETPAPPKPYLSPRELDELQKIHNAAVGKGR